MYINQIYEVGSYFLISVLRGDGIIKLGVKNSK